MPELDRAGMEALRQPLEDRVVAGGGDGDVSRGVHAGRAKQGERGVHAAGFLADGLALSQGKVRLPCLVFLPSSPSVLCCVLLHRAIWTDISRWAAIRR